MRIKVQDFSIQAESQIEARAVDELGYCYTFMKSGLIVRYKPEDLGKDFFNKIIKNAVVFTNITDE